MKKTRIIIWINAGIVLACIFGVLYFSTKIDTNWYEFFYDTFSSILTGAIVALVFTVYDYIRERQAFSSMIRRYKGKIYYLLKDKDSNSDEVKKQLHELSKEFFEQFAEYLPSHKSEELFVLLAICGNDGSTETQFKRLRKTVGLHS